MGILARKGDQEKEFTETAWRILGKNKNGWEQVSNSVAKNIATPKEKPDTGEAVEKDKPQTTKNTLEEAPKEEATAPVEEVDVKEVFLKAVKENNITKNAIKDYFDAKAISYKAGDSLDKLADTLYTAMNGDVAELNTQFVI